MSMDAGTSGKKPTSDHNPWVIFIGFLLLGAALALLLFGRDLFNGGEDEEAAVVGEPEVTVLDQVSELPTIGELDGETSPANRPGGPLSAGDLAQDFTLSDLDGNLVSLADFRGRPVIVNFWASWCAPCRIEMPELQRAFEQYEGDGLAILALDQDESADVARAYFYDEMNLTFTPLLDEGSSVSTSYGSFGVLPSTYFVDVDGIVSAIHRGPLTLGQIEGYLSGMMAKTG